MAYEIVNSFPNDIIYQEEGPFISLYQPTHRHFPENRQDPIMFKNLIRVIENSLRQKYEKDFVISIMKPFYELEKDEYFWNNTSEGIAVLASKDKCIIYNLQGIVKKFTTVANSFHIKPLIKAFQSMESYQLLGLSRTNFTLYQGNRNGFSEIVLPLDTPRTLEEVLGKQLTDPYLASGSGGTGGHTVYHGHGGAKPEIDNDTEKYFRYVDHFVMENYSKPSKLPLILVSLMEYHTEFKNISSNPYLIEEGIHNSYDSLKIDELKTKALEIIKPINLKKIQILAESYKKAEAESLGSSDLVQVAKAAFDSRVETILLEENRIVPGKIDYDTGTLIPGARNDLDCDDILDDLAELTFMRKGNVLVLPKDKMPSTTGVAAIYRY
ncbi:hypothetical protein [uncultured Sphaerochaeta sp.]|uniref:baeRF3 domain-containing protein n=1 Tax=uncultured Sphaerochaeta sp. TaxID=886478 RepID=UPI002A0A4152|nr:hypothetical protein [uncultured Sphaerochaeta sp.]